MSVTVPCRGQCEVSYKVSYVDVVRRVLDVRTRVHTLVSYKSLCIVLK